MKAVIQRVTRASASVDGEQISSIGKGLCVLIGITKDDQKCDVEYIVKKILNTRFFEDETGKRWTKSVKDMDYEVLCLSQVTLCHRFKGQKLDFHMAMSPEASKELFHNLVSQIKAEFKHEKVKEGKFGAYSQIEICNDGPVTVVIDSPKEKE